MKTTASPAALEHTLNTADWIEETAERLNIPVTVHPLGISRDGDWLHVPVAVRQGENAYQRAVLIQQVEDEWAPSRHGGLNLLLVPAKAEQPSMTGSYARIGELMARQHQLLDQFDESGSSAEDAVQRHQAVRQEWEATLLEMERLFPALSQSIS